VSVGDEDDQEGGEHDPVLGRLFSTSAVTTPSAVCGRFSPLNGSLIRVV
jgi:hypothetical protein